LPAIYESRTPQAVDRNAAAAHLSEHIVFGEVGGQILSPAEMLLALLDVRAETVDGPTGPGRTTYTKATIPAGVFRNVVADAVDFVRRFQRLPNEVFFGPETLSLADFAASLAGRADEGGDVRVVRGKVEFDRYFASDGRKSFNWVIHPEGFDGTRLLELGRLQGWTLKPARLKR